MQYFAEFNQPQKRFTHHHLKLDLKTRQDAVIFCGIIVNHYIEQNPAEHVWEYIRENDIRNQVFSDLDKVMDAVEVSLHRLHGTPNTLRSMTAFPWILEAVACLLYL